jgi:hypothetical protein
LECNGHDQPSPGRWSSEGVGGEFRACDRITATIPEFRRISGIGRSRIYELLDAGELESIYIGARRLILIDSYRRLIERCRQSAARTE